MKKIKGGCGSFYFYFVLASCIGVCNLLSYTSFSASLLLVAIEGGVLAGLIVADRRVEYLCLYLIFVCLSFEFPDLVGTENFYGFKNFELLGVNLGVLFLLPYFFLACFRFPALRSLREKNRSLYFLLLCIFYLSFSGILIGAVQIFLNDNGIRNLPGHWKEYVKYTYKMVCIPVLMIFNYLYAWRQEKFQAQKIKGALTAVLLANCVTLAVSLLFKIRGQYGGHSTLLVSSTNLYIPFLFVLALHERDNRKKLLLVTLGGIGVGLSLYFNASGKIFLILILIGLYAWIYLLTRLRHKTSFFFFLLLPILCAVGYAAVTAASADSKLFLSKLNQAVSVLDIGRKDWLASMPASPRMRIAEFINIGYEYGEKPWQLIWGKGYLGTVLNRSGLMTFTKDAFTDVQWEYSMFYAMHESLNKLFLNHGLIGVFLLAAFIINMLRRCVRNPWVILGTFWFAIVYGYSVTMSVFGILCLLISCETKEGGAAV